MRSASLSLLVTVLVLGLVLMFLRRRETFQVHTQAWSNGKLTPETVRLEAYVRSLNPAMWMDGETYHNHTWMDKSGRGNNSTETRAIQVQAQNSSAHGCNSAFKYICGRHNWKSSLVLGNGFPTNKEYTFFHVTRYDGPTRRRIWTNRRAKSGRDSVNWLSGHWGGRSNRSYHNEWLQWGRTPPSGQYVWQLTADRHDRCRSKVSGMRRDYSHSRRGRRFRPLSSGPAIGIHAKYSREQSDWACAEVIVFDQRLSDKQVAEVEKYLELKYGFV